MDSVDAPGAPGVSESELEYRKDCETIDMLYQMSLARSGDKHVIDMLACSVPSTALINRMIFPDFSRPGHYKIQPEFFDTLPYLNKMGQLYENFSLNHKPFSHNSDLYHLSSDAKYNLALSIEAVDDGVLDQLDEKRASDLLCALKVVMSSDLGWGIERAVNFFNKNKEGLRKIGGVVSETGVVDREIFELEEYITSRDFEFAVLDGVQNSINLNRFGRREAKVEYCADMVRRMVERYGLSYDELWDVWKGSYTQHGPEPQIANNIKRIISIEEQRSGGAKLLYEQFGIRNFERYPISILIGQIDTFDQKDKPYGILVGATHDWNGAFGLWSNKEVWDRLYSEIGDQYDFRIVEADGKMELARRLLFLDRKYGERQKISFAFLCGHGTDDYIVFGGSHNRNLIHVDDLKGKGVGRSGGFFVEHPTIVLVSCSTGVPGGIGQRLSSVLGAKVIAPDVPTNIGAVDPVISDGGMTFNVEYSLQKNGKNATRTYLAGESVD